MTLDPAKEVLSLIGSKEGIGHIALCFIDPGDVALVPDPAYPVYEIGTMFAGGETYTLPLLEENGFLPDFDAVPADVASRAKVLWLNYPNNPTGAVADIDFFERAVALREAARHRHLPRRAVQRGRVRRVRARQLPAGEGRDGRRHRVPLAVEELQHDRLAHRHGRRQPAASSTR